ncbi:MAG TPA: DUF4199 domain-containing protein, partial [Chitinophagales bacterium]
SMNWNIPIRWGLISGLASVILSILIYITTPESFASMWFGFLGLGIALFFMIWGGVSFRRENNNHISFVQALGAVLIIGAISSLLTSLFSYILFNFIDVNLADLLKQKVIENTTEMLEKFNTPEDATEAALDKIKEQDFHFGLKEFAIRYLQGLGFYAVLGAIVSAFIKRPDEKAVAPTEE